MVLSCIRTLQWASPSFHSTYRNRRENWSTAHRCSKRRMPQ